jgi:Galactose oxidase, central domain
MIVLVGGNTLTEVPFGDTWRWNGTRWKELAVDPPSIVEAAMTYDSVRGKLVMFGGRVDDRDGDRNHTLEWDGGWQDVTPTTISPTPRRSHAMAYDAARKQVVLFGGFGRTVGNEFGPLGDTWVFDGSTWDRKTPISSPPPRQHHVMIYDAARQRVVLFGGSGTNQVRLSDTWTWDGNEWELMPSNVQPTTGGMAAIGYDSKRKRVVLFGGGTNIGSDETWEWDGVDWSRQGLASLSLPRARYGATLVFDENRQAMVLWGGIDLVATFMNDTWIWDGVNWLEQAPINAPAARANHVASFSSLHNKIVVFGGLANSTTFINDTWEYSFEGPKMSAESCQSAAADADADGLAGCADPDCWGRCEPTCSPYTSCPTAPRCGDGVCNDGLEDKLLCPGDCP